MSKKTDKKPWYQALLGAKRTIDEALEEAKETQDSEEETEDEDEDESNSKTNDALNLILKKLKTMDADIQELKAKSEDSDDESETKDSDEEVETIDDILEAEEAEKADVGTTYTGDSLQDLRSRAEILAPGLKLPTLDSASKDIAKVANTAKRNALKQAYATVDGLKAIGPFVGGANADIDALPAYTIDAAFVGASELIKQQNNLKGVRTGVTTKDFGRAAPTPSDINAKNRAFWSKK